jgi:hypothetical protein
MDKPGRFLFVTNRDIRLSYEYAYREMTKADLWNRLRGLSSLQEMFESPEFKQLKMRKGSRWASTLNMMFQIAHLGWELAAQKALQRQVETGYA